MSIRKVGGIWFARVWRIRVSFCIARPVHNTEKHYGRTVLHERYLGG